METTHPSPIFRQCWWMRSSSLIPYQQTKTLQMLVVFVCQSNQYLLGNWVFVKPYVFIDTTIYSYSIFTFYNGGQMLDHMASYHHNPYKKAPFDTLSLYRDDQREARGDSAAPKLVELARRKHCLLHIAVQKKKHHMQSDPRHRKCSCKLYRFKAFTLVASVLSHAYICFFLFINITSFTSYNHYILLVGCILRCAYFFPFHIATDLNLLLVTHFRTHKLQKCIL